MGGGEAKKRKKPHKSCRRDRALAFRTRHHFFRQGVALAGTRQLRSQGPVSVHAHRTEGVTESEGREGANGVGGGNGDVNGDRDGGGAETRTGVEANEGRQDGNGDGRRDGRRDGPGTGTVTGSGKAEERRRSARNRKRGVDAVWETGET